MFSPAAQHEGTERLGPTDVPSNLTMERDGPPPATPDPGWRDVQSRGPPLRDSREDGALVTSDPKPPGS
eukprot:404320-Rhodomonas_salina.1